jgi:hypothetical protein
MNKFAALAGLLLLVCCPVLRADVSEAEVQALREQIRLLSQRLDQLEHANQTAQAAPTPASAPALDESALDEKIDQAVATKVEEKTAGASWAERMRWSGDFRYRYENIVVEDGADRNRNRIRARAVLEADVSDTMRVGLGLATGSDDPVSTNQTLGGGGSTKPINLDLAYFEWSGLADTRVVGGKFKNQLHRAGGNALLWDSDWRPEGTSLSYDNGTLFAVGMGTWVESDSAKQQKEFAYALQGGVNWPLGDAAKLTAGAGYYQFNAAGRRSFFGDGDFFGNSFDPVTSTYLYDYHEIEGFAELGFALFGHPASVFADYVYNDAVDDNNEGYAFGLTYGKAKAKGTWDVSYVYQRLEADAVLGLLTDSDYGGGGTDSKGSVFKATYAFHDNWFFEGTYFLNQIDLASGNTRDFDRLQLDLNFKFK